MKTFEAYVLSRCNKETMETAYKSVRGYEYECDPFTFIIVKEGSRFKAYEVTTGLSVTIEDKLKDVTEYIDTNIERITKCMYDPAIRVLQMKMQEAYREGGQLG